MDVSSGNVNHAGELSDQNISNSHAQKGNNRRVRLEKVGHYKVGQTLGRGNFATVRVAYHEIANTKVAIKVVDSRNLSADNMAKIEREVEILQKIAHPHIIKLYQIMRTERYLYIVTEYVSNGELFDMLMERGRQTEDESRRLFQQIASAVLYCHSNGIVHRDLKAENLLIDKKGNIKLIDFGFSNYQVLGETLSTWCGSPPYAAPELLLAQAYDGRTSDVWSLGVILYILVTAGFPFPGESVDKLKRAVLGDHLKIPFWVSVECADLIRRMLTISPKKRCTMQNVVQHRWFTSKLPDDIKSLVNAFLTNKNTSSSTSANVPNETANSTSQTSDRVENQAASLQKSRTQIQLDPTVLIFMQQHTKWTEEQIHEEVSSRNYLSPIFATYELLLAKLNEFKNNENNGSSGAQLRLDTDQNRRGSRGSILSGKANVEPDAVATTIPAHHLAKLSLTANIDDESDESSTSDMCESSSLSSKVAQQYMSTHSQQIQSQEHAQQQQTSSTYKVRRRRGMQALQDRQQHLMSAINNDVNRRHTLCAAASGTTPLNPLLSAAAQQFSVDTRAWANAAAAAALFATQLHRRNNQQQLLQQQESTHQQQLQQTALNLLSFQNFPLDYTRVINAPNQERRASANEALLGLNNYAHLLAACSTMGISGVNVGTNDYMNSASRSVVSPRDCCSDNSCSPTRSTIASVQKNHQSIEEEGKNYLNDRGNTKRNTVHAGAAYGGGLHSASLSHRHGPYSKQNSVVLSASTSGMGNNSSGSHERRSSWASSASTTINGLNISAQQQAQLEHLYRQSIGSSSGNNQTMGDVSSSSAVGNNSATASINFHPSESMTGVQQLQYEFQALCASTTKKDVKQFHSFQQRSNSHLPMSASYNVINSLLDVQNKAPTISITDENNESLTSPLPPSYSPIGFLSSTTANEPRPATVIGFSSSMPYSGNSTPTISTSLAQTQSSPQKNVKKFIFVPVSPDVALERLDRLTNASETSQIRYETQMVIAEEDDSSEAVRIRVTPDDGHTILEMTLYPMHDSPHISKAMFTMVNGDTTAYNTLRQQLLATFHEVY